ncbi:hypothetical protein EI94DRAFT_1816687 [Lactarius quietus]|nr:hypothetical protein EI94DRAFT_1816687 [Lactarius quietus]
MTLLGLTMDASQANSREYLRQVIDTELQSLERSIRALKYRRNVLAPISSLPTEVIEIIFSLLYKKPDPLAWLRGAHVCHQWREIALNQPRFWSHVNFTTLTSAGVAEILARAKMVPLYLEAKGPDGHMNNPRCTAFQKELQKRVSHTSHLLISAISFHLHKTFIGLESPAPTAELPNTLFNGSTPNLSCLELHNCNISWESPLLKGLRYLEIHSPSVESRPSLSVWLDALDNMSQLKTLTLHWASPIAPSGVPLPFDVERTTALPSLTDLDISASPRACALALAHLRLPALTHLSVATKCRRRGSNEAQEILPYVAQHAHGPQDTQPLRSVLIHARAMRIDILAWTAPDIDFDVRDSILFLNAMLSARMTLSITITDWSVEDTHTMIFDVAMAALPFDRLVTLSAPNPIKLDEHVWRHHAPRLPLLQCARLSPPAARGFRSILLDKGENEGPLLPSLKKLVLNDAVLKGPWILGLCDILMKRVDQSVPLEVLDLRTCAVTDPAAIQQLSEIVVVVWGPTEETLKTRRPSFTTCYFEADVDEEDDPEALGDGDDEEGNNMEFDVDEAMMDEYWDYWPMEDDQLILAAIFSFLVLPWKPLQGVKPDHHLVRLRISHVCHQWREIVLNQPLFWNHVDFTYLSSAGAAEILARAKTVPLYLKAKVTFDHWDYSRFSAFREELQRHIPHICHLLISANASHLRHTLSSLVSPAYSLERLSLFGEKYCLRAAVPKTLFGGTVPRLSYLKISHCDISWPSPLFKGLRYLDIRSPSTNSVPKLSVWLDALEEMPQLKILTLHAASPFTNSFPSPFHVKRTVTLPSLTHINITNSPHGCALTLAHLDLPALTCLCLNTCFCFSTGDDVQDVLPYVARHALGYQGTQPLQSVLIRGKRMRAEIFAWPVPDIDVEVHEPPTWLAATPPARVILSLGNHDLDRNHAHTESLGMVMAALPLDGLVTLWPLLRRVRLTSIVADRFIDFLLEDKGGRENPLLPSLKELVLVDSYLCEHRTLPLCDVLMKRVEQGFLLEMLDLRTCCPDLDYPAAVRLLSEIVVDVLDPEETPDARAQVISMWDRLSRGSFVEHVNSGEEIQFDDSDDESDTSDNDEGEDDEDEGDDE